MAADEGKGSRQKGELPDDVKDLNLSESEKIFYTDNERWQVVEVAKLDEMTERYTGKCGNHLMANNNSNKMVDWSCGR